MVLKNVRISYAHVWEPRESFGTMQYSCSILIPKDDPQVQIVMAEIDRLKKEYATSHNGKIPANFKNPLRDGDEERPDDPNYADCFFMNANSKKRAPEIVDLYKRPITDQSQVYSGCYVNISVSLYTFDQKSKGVACGLNNIQKVKDGPRLGGATSANEDFQVEEPDSLID